MTKGPVFPFVTGKSSRVWLLQLLSYVLYLVFRSTDLHHRHCNLYMYGVLQKDDGLILTGTGEFRLNPESFVRDVEEESSIIN